MGRVGRLLSFVRAGAGVTDVTIDRGGGDARTLQHFSPPGDDSFPLPGDSVQTADQAGTGRSSAVGYGDPVNTPTAQPGDKRIYSRDRATGEAIAEVWAKNTGEVTTANDNGSVTLAPDGSILGQNASGSFELQTSGDFVVNGVTIAADGSVTIPTSLTLNGKEIAGHDHPAGTPPGNTGPNN